ncbi:hypothetical protein GGF37_000817 [Kickxella alabastrina]|nr:hypothetical protein GGF37_000817 [Kickxella alabastrina]
MKKKGNKMEKPATIPVKENQEVLEHQPEQEPEQEPESKHLSQEEKVCRAFSGMFVSVSRGVAHDIRDRFELDAVEVDRITNDTLDRFCAKMTLMSESMSLVPRSALAVKRSQEVAPEEACKFVLIRGDNKGRECGKKSVKDYNYCSTHKAALNKKGTLVQAIADATAAAKAANAIARLNQEAINGKKVDGSILKFKACEGLPKGAFMIDGTCILVYKENEDAEVGPSNCLVVGHWDGEKIGQMTDAEKMIVLTNKFAMMEGINLRDGGALAGQDYGENHLSKNKVDVARTLLEKKFAEQGFAEDDFFRRVMFSYTMGNTSMVVKNGNIDTEQTHWQEFADRNKDLLSRNWVILNRRREELSKMNISIFPDNDKVFEVLSCIKPSEVKHVLILPHPYNFDSGTGIPCMVKRRMSFKPKSLMNIQKAFDVSDVDFSNIWNSGTLLINIALTEEESKFSDKIPHELFWSLLFEDFLVFMSSSFMGIRFSFTGSTSGKFKKFIDTTNGHTIQELAAITDDAFCL